MKGHCLQKVIKPVYKIALFSRVGKTVLLSFSIWFLFIHVCK